MNSLFLMGLLMILTISFWISHALTRQQMDGELRLEILQNGEIAQTHLLTEGEAQSIKVTAESGRYNLVEIDGERVRVAEAECPNQICVNTGWVSHPGQVVVCAPNKLVLLVKGSAGDIDAITW